MISKDAYIEARKHKDKNFDGKFYFGVKTTGIYCMPSCPAPLAKEDNVRYFNTIDEAEALGYKPCKRCHPHTLISTSREYVEKALVIISHDYKNPISVETLARKCFVSERHLRTCFKQSLGCTPNEVISYYVMREAHARICHTDDTFKEIAGHLGFHTTRQLSQLFSKQYKVTPTALRKGNSIEIGLKMVIPCDDKEAFYATLEFMAQRCLKGIEIVNEMAYLRTYHLPSGKGYFKVFYDVSLKQVLINLFTDDLLSSLHVFEKVKKMFDLDTDLEHIKNTLAKDRWLIPDDTITIKRLPRAFDSLEFLVRAILGQQITVKAATTLAGRIVERYHHKTTDDYPDGLSFYFPSLDGLLSMSFEALGITHTRQETLRRVLIALKEGDFNLTEQQSFDAFSKAFREIKGIGEWTTHYVAMRGLGMVDSFPSTDLGVMKAMASAPCDQTKKGLLAYAENWRPYRAYATLLLWDRL
jgi:AraC family transcriptional regulator of adaptative response / DNA-3-methyladenine glycosylase II